MTTPKDEQLKPCDGEKDHVGNWSRPFGDEQSGRILRCRKCGHEENEPTNTRRALPLTEQEREALAWGDKLTETEPPDRWALGKAHDSIVTLTKLVRRLTSPDK